ncbi:MAG: carbohydrate binding family 9 domain-containing protein [Candidatus Latescibacteria bacterium]|nr:carbohydrate binding family 9 domain-containing protein [Candidatus Latescibacterota bacterium]
MLKKATSILAGVLSGGLLLSSVSIAQTRTVQDSAKVVRLADVGRETDPVRTTPTVQSLADHPFNIPKPVATEPFDYGSLSAGNYDLEALQITSQVELDGLLNEPDWQMATPAKDFYQFEPSQGAPASQPTEVRVLYDRENLYVGFICYDDDPDALMAPDMSRDTRLSFSNDMVRIVIAPLEGGREAYEFQTNANGARSDAFVSKQGNNSDQDWNGYWDVSARRTDYGWTAEFMIPFYTLRFPSGEVHNWSVNFGRRIQRNREQSYWVPLNRSDGRQALYRFQKGGRLVGLKNIQPGGRFQFLPFTALGPQSARSNRLAPSVGSPIALTGTDNAFARQIGGDFKWSVTSGITYNASINPDFAQVEADDQVVNLSRFAFQFSEKRPFFLERSDIFALNTGGGRRRGGGGGGGSDPTPLIFFSRRVGRQLADGSTAPIDLGQRITGKIGGTTLGYLNVQTRERIYKDDGVSKTEPMTSWQALRVSQDIGSRSNMGLLATFKEPNPGFHKELGTPLPRFSSRDYNRVLGFDGNLAFRNSQHNFSAMFAKSWTDTLQNKVDELTFRMQARWQNRWMGYGISYLEVGDNFKAQSGFVRRDNIRRIGAGVQFNPFIRKYGLRRIEARISGNYLAPRDKYFDDPETWQLSPSVFWELERGLWISTGWTRTFDTLDSDDDILGVDFQAGEYTYDQGSLFLFTNRGKPVSGQLSGRFGKFYSADLISLSGELSLKPNPKFSLEPGVTWTRIDQPGTLGATLAANNKFFYKNGLIPRLRGRYSFTPNLSLTSFVQMNADKKRPSDSFHTNTITMNFLLAYRSPFGHAFFLAFNQFLDDDIDTDSSFGAYSRTPLKLRDQTVTAKVTYLFNL